MENWKSGYSRFVTGLGCVTFALITACGELTTDTEEPPEGEAVGEGAGETEILTDLNHPSGNTAVVVGTDFVTGTLTAIPLGSPAEATRNVAVVHSDAAIRSYGGSLYVVNRLGADNIQVLNPSNFETTLQFSTGNGTNPQDIIVTAPDQAFISLYQPDDNSSEDLSVEEVLSVDPSTGNVKGSIDLTPLTADDGERLARASDMVAVEGEIFVGLQDLSGTFAADQAGKIAVIDIDTASLVDSVTLLGRNPIAMDWSPDTGLLYVANADFVDTSSSFGGIEIVNPSSRASGGIFIDDLDLGGSLGDIEVHGTKGYVVVGFFDEAFNFLSKVVSFDLEPGKTPTLTEVFVGGGFIQDIAIDENGHLLVGDQDPTVSGIVTVDLETNTPIGDPVTTGGAPTSITFVDR